MAIPVACRCGGKRIDGKCDRCGRGKRREHDRTTKERGYDDRWKRLSRAIRKEISFCVPCWHAGKSERAAACHHIVKVKDAPHLRHDRDNIMPVCEACHAVLDEQYDRDRLNYDARIKVLRETQRELTTYE